MIYDRENIQIPDLCPLQFTEPLDYSFYEEQFQYAQKIKNITNNPIQILISEEFYNAKEKVLELCIIDKNDNELFSFQFERNMLSTGYYYANAVITQLPINEYVYFQIKYDGNYIATSLWYLCLPEYSSDIKKIEYSNDKNYFNCIFNESLTVLDLPVVKSLRTTWFTKAKQEITETKYKLTLTVSDLYYPDLIEDFDVYWIGDNRAEKIISVIADGSPSYIIEVDINDLKTKTLSIWILKASDNSQITKQTIPYLYNTTTFTRTNYFSFDLECGFIPTDNRDEQIVEEYVDQSLINSTIYGDEYEVTTITLGDSSGIPNYLRKKFSRASMLDYFEIDGEEVRRIEGAKIEKQEDTENGLAIYKLDLQKPINYLQ